ncbi:MAG: PmoA family protein [Opitutaceae bacterium]|nr:PmoA family protein [Opitutaceae bacterium]
MKHHLVSFVATFTVLASCALAAEEAKVTPAGDRIRIELGGKLFTEYVFKAGPRPYLYPVLAADGTEMMRHYPMKKEVPGEAYDHPHHRSLWFTHGDVNGLDFWAETGGAKQGRILNEKVSSAVEKGAAVIRASSKWVGPDDAVHMTDDTVIRARAIAGGRLLDYEVTLKAPADKAVTLGDTKEGSMAIRLPLWMTPTHSYSVNKQRVKHEGKGTIINAEGIKNDATWGKRSTWVDYHAPKDGKVYGVAMFDHPSNPRHPTWWHVRSYALFAANPFGKHDFENLKDQPKAGALTIPAGGSVTFRWRFYFHMGDEKAGQVAEQYQAYVAGK